MKFKPGHTYKLFGNLIGPIWLPAIQCTKEFNKSFALKQEYFTHPASNLVDACDHLLNDGDFQYCQFLVIYLTDSYRKEGKLIEETFEITEEYLSEEYFYQEGIEC